MSRQHNEDGTRQTKTTALSKTEINRRNFVQKVLAGLPALGLTCAIPGLVLASDSSGKTEEPRWICRVKELFGAPFLWSAYVFVDCVTEQVFLEIDEPGLQCAKCDNPSQPGCAPIGEFLAHEVVSEGLTFSYSPNLSQEARQSFEGTRALLEYNISFGANPIGDA